MRQRRMRPKSSIEPVTGFTPDSVHASVEVHVSAVSQFFQPSNLIGHDAAQRQREEIVEAEKFDRVGFQAEHLARLHHLTEKNELPDMEDRRRMRMLGRIPSREQANDLGRISAFLADLLGGMLRGGRSHVGPAAGKRLQSIGRFPHEQYLSGFVEHGASDVELRVGIPRFECEELGHLAGFERGDIGELLMGDGRDFLATLPVEGAGRTVQPGLRQREQTAGLLESSLERLVVG